MTAFMYFIVNTFTNMEWGHGNEKHGIFNPTQFDARQWVKTLINGTMKFVNFTSKHQDGFCLWPTKTTEYSVSASGKKKVETISINNGKLILSIEQDQAILIEKY